MFKSNLNTTIMAVNNLQSIINVSNTISYFDEQDKKISLSSKAHKRMNYLYLLT